MEQPEPISYFLELYGYHSDQIDSFIQGEKYIACYLKNGRLGVCAKLNHIVQLNDHIPNLLNPNSAAERILLNAYYNAQLNDHQPFSGHHDIFDFVSFTTFEKIAMVGYFKPLVKKFRDKNILIDIFDHRNLTDELIPMVDQRKYLADADAIILTATSIFNKTFIPIINASKHNAQVFLLGPSSILHRHMLNYRNIRGIFGMVFPDRHDEVLTMIKMGHGTRIFGKLGQKVNI